MKTMLRLGLACGVFALGMGGHAGGAEPKPGEVKASEAKTAGKPAASLDDELFKDLDDGSGKPKQPAKPAASAKTDTATKPRTVAPAKADAKPEPATEPAPAQKPAASTGPTSDGARSDGPQSKSDAKPIPKPSNPLDAELLKDLEGDQPEQKKPKTQPKPSAGAGAGSDSDDPLVRLSRRIREAETRIRRSESGEETQKLQRDIVEDLEKLIAKIEEQQQKSQGQPKPGSPKPGSKPGEKKPGQQPGNSGDDSQPASDSNDDGKRKTAQKKADPGKLKNMLDQIWGMLPERERQDVMQSSVDDFPVKYQYVIEEYFRTLLERRD